MSRINFTVPKDDRAIVKQIVARFRNLIDQLTGEQVDEIHIQMNLIACHNHGMPLDWTKLLNSDDFAFVHDITGIDRHLNRNTGKLNDFFSPRCAAPAFHEGAKP